jgi:hypothetical protein
MMTQYQRLQERAMGLAFVLGAVLLTTEHRSAALKD